MTYDAAGLGMHSASLSLRSRVPTMFSFQGFPMFIVIALVAMAWLSFLSVVLFG